MSSPEYRTTVLKPALSGLFSLLLLALPAHALELGELVIHSALGSPLSASVPVLQVGKGDPDLACVRVLPSSLGLGEPPSETRARVEGADPRLIRVESPQAVWEPVFSLSLEIGCQKNRRSWQEFVVLLDPVQVAPRAVPIVAPGPAADPPPIAPSAPAQAAIAAPAELTPAPVAIQHFRSIRARPGDSLLGMLRAMFSVDGEARQALARAIMEANPQAFVAGRVRGMRSGALLRVPVDNAVSYTPRVQLPSLDYRIGGQGPAPRRPNYAHRNFKRQNLPSILRLAWGLSTVEADIEKMRLAQASRERAGTLPPPPPPALPLRPEPVAAVQAAEEPAPMLRLGGDEPMAEPAGVVEAPRPVRTGPAEERHRITVFAARPEVREQPPVSPAEPVSGSEIDRLTLAKLGDPDVQPSADAVAASPPPKVKELESTVNQLNARIGALQRLLVERRGAHDERQRRDFWAQLMPWISSALTALLLLAVYYFVVRRRTRMQLSAATVAMHSMAGEVRANGARAAAANPESDAGMPRAKGQKPPRGYAFDRDTMSIPPQAQPLDVNNVDLDIASHAPTSSEEAVQTPGGKTEPDAKMNSIEAAMEAGDGAGAQAEHVAIQVDDAYRERILKTVPLALMEAELHLVHEQFPEAFYILRSLVESDSPKHPDIRSWMRLFDLFRLRDDQKSFELLVGRFTGRYNVEPPVWGEGGVGQQQKVLLEEYPWIEKHLAETWASTNGLRFLDALLLDDREGERKGFSMAVAEEISLLRAMLFELAVV